MEAEHFVLAGFSIEMQIVSSADHQPPFVALMNTTAVMRAGMLIDSQLQLLNSAPKMRPKNSVESLET